MTERPMLKCGHVAMSIHSNPHDQFDGPHPSCVICFNGPRSLACQPDPNVQSLEGRMAICSFATKRDGSPHEPVPSSYDLAFFQYRGPGSPDASRYCKQCPYTREAHKYFPYFFPGLCRECHKDGLRYVAGGMFKCDNCGSQFHAAALKAKHNPHIENHEFEEHGPFEYDHYYCGCWGWD